MDVLNLVSTALARGRGIAWIARTRDSSLGEHNVSSVRQTVCSKLRDFCVGQLPQ